MNFYIGQEVVCINDKFQGRSIDLFAPIKKGQVFTVIGVDAGCCSGIIDIGLTSITKFSTCSKCGVHYTTPNNNFWLKADRFAPIERIRTKYVAVAEEITQLEKCLS